MRILKEPDMTVMYTSPLGYKSLIESCRNNNDLICEVTIENADSDTQYFHPNFRLKFDGTLIDIFEYFWIDEVTVVGK